MSTLLRPLLVALLCLGTLLPSTQPAAAAPGDKEMSPEARYELGLRQMKRGYYTRALEQFNRVRNYYRDDPVSVKAELAIADVYYKKHDYEQARLAYEDFARLHPRHADLDYVTYRIGLCLYQRAPKVAGRDQTATRQAVAVWSSFEARFPDSDYYEEATKLLDRSRDRLAAKELFIARHYARKEAWLAVRRRAEEVVRRYPESEHSPGALALMARAYHAWGMVDEASSAREQLASDYEAPRLVSKVDRVLAGPPGEPPEEQTFIRPYRVPGMGSGTGPM